MSDDFKPGDRIQIKSNVFYKGVDLSYKTGMIKRTNSYLEVFVFDLKKVIKLFRFEVTLNLFDEFDYTQDE
jgi:hypothetical protein